MDLEETQRDPGLLLLWSLSWLLLAIYCSWVQLLLPQSGLYTTCAGLLIQSTQPHALHKALAPLGLGGKGCRVGAGGVGQWWHLFPAEPRGVVIDILEGDDGGGGGGQAISRHVCHLQGQIVHGNHLGVVTGVGGQDGHRARQGAGRLQIQPMQEGRVAGRDPQTLPGPKLWGYVCCLASQGLMAPLSTLDSALA